MFQVLAWVPVAITVRDLLIDMTVAKSSEMSPTVTDGSVVVINKWSTQLGGIKRGDVVVLDSNEDRSKRFDVSRVVGLQGDWVRKMDDTYVHVEKGHCWVEKDGATDENLGGKQVPLGVLAGRALFVAWPPWKVHRLSSTNPKAKGRVSARTTRRPFSSEKNV